MLDRIQRFQKTVPKGSLIITHMQKKVYYKWQYHDEKLKYIRKYLSKKEMKQIQLFVNGQNLFTFSPLKMFDPEIDLSSTNLIQYPSLKTYNFGFNITF